MDYPLKKITDDQALKYLLHYKVKDIFAFSKCLHVV